MPDETPLLSYGEAASFLNLPLGTMYALVSQRRIPHVRLGRRLVRFHRRDLELWLTSNRVGAVDQLSEGA
jgi:excisionase family DNA binding protein